MHFLQDLLLQYTKASVQEKTKILNKILEALTLLNDMELEIYLPEVAKVTGISKTKLAKLIKEEKEEKKKVELKPVSNTVFFHPALDFKKGIFWLGFRAHFEINDGVAEKNFYIYSTLTDEVGIIIDKERFKLYDTYWMPEGTDHRVLMNINTKWSFENLLDLVNGKVKVRLLSNIYGEIYSIFKQFVELQNENHYHLLTAWTIGTYFYVIFEAYPYLSLSGAKCSGKTKTLSLLEKLCFNAVKSKVTFASLADTLDSLRGTLLIDQAEDLNDFKSADLVGLLADGYKKDNGKRRLVLIQSNQRKVVELETYAPKAFASVKGLPDDLMDRVIEIPMIKTLLPLPDLDELDNQRVKEIRSALYSYLITNWAFVRDIYKETGANLKGRMRELWRPLETIFRIVELKPELIEAIKMEFLGLVGQNQATLPDNVQLLFEAILTMAGSDDVLETTCSDILSKMRELDEDLSNNITTQWIGKALQTSRVGKKTGKRLANKTLWLVDISKVKKIVLAYTNNIANIAEIEKKEEMSESYELQCQKPQHCKHCNIANLTVNTSAKLQCVQSEGLQHCKVQNTENSKDFNNSAMCAEFLEGNKKKIFSNENVKKKIQLKFWYEV